MNIRLPASRRSRRAARLPAAAAAVLAAPVLLGAMLAGPASASTSFAIHLTPDNTFGLLLDVPGASAQPGAPVIDWWSDSGANHAWTFYSIGGNHLYEIISNNSGMCMTSDDVAGDQVYQDPCTGSELQLWRTYISPYDTSTYPIQNVYSGLYVDVNGASPWPGAPVDTWPYDGGSNQFFGAL